MPERPGTDGFRRPDAGFRRDFIAFSSQRVAPGRIPVYEKVDTPTFRGLIPAE
jgi:hypothetical protein